MKLMSFQRTKMQNFKNILPQVIIIFKVLLQWKLINLTAFTSTSFSLQKYSVLKPEVIVQIIIKDDIISFLKYVFSLNQAVWNEHFLFLNEVCHQLKLVIRVLISQQYLSLCHYQSALSCGSPGAQLHCLILDMF